MRRGPGGRPADFTPIAANSFGFALAQAATTPPSPRVREHDLGLCGNATTPNVTESEPRADEECIFARICNERPFSQGVPGGHIKVCQGVTPNDTPGRRRDRAQVASRQVRTAGAGTRRKTVTRGARRGPRQRVDCARRPVGAEEQAQERAQQARRLARAQGIPTQKRYAIRKGIDAQEGRSTGAATRRDDACGLNVSPGKAAGRDAAWGCPPDGKAR